LLSDDLFDESLSDKLTSKDFDIEILDTEIVDASKYAEDDKPNIAIDLIHYRKHPQILILF
jgi:hypothetical protein